MDLFNDLCLMWMKIINKNFANASQPYRQIIYIQMKADDEVHAAIESISNGNFIAAEILCNQQLIAQISG